MWQGLWVKLGNQVSGIIYDGLKWNKIYYIKELNKPINLFSSNPNSVTSCVTIGKSLNLSELNIANYTKLHKELELMV